MNNIGSLIIYSLLILVVVIVSVYTITITRAYRIDKRNLEYYRKTILQRNGWTFFCGNYDIISLDTGKNWYAVERKDNEVKILGTAEEIYPKLLGFNAGIEMLEEFAARGEIIPEGRIRSEFNTLMENLKECGFVIKKGKNE